MSESTNPLEQTCIGEAVSNFTANWRSWAIPDESTIAQSTDEKTYELMERGGLTFRPLVTPVIYHNPVTGQDEQYDDKFVVINGNTGANLAIVGKQMKESFNIGGHYEATEKLLSQIVNIGGIPTRAMSFANGARALIQLKIPQTYYVAGIENHGFYTVSNALDGTSITKIGFTAFTPRCINTYRAALRDLGNGWYAKHTGNYGEKLSSIQRILFGIQDEVQNYFTLQNKLATIAADSETVKIFANYLIPDKAAKTDSERKANTGPTNRRGELVKAIETSLQERESKELTIYDLLRGVTRYTTYRKDDPEYAFFGPGSDLADKAHSWAEKNYL